VKREELRKLLHELVDVSASIHFSPAAKEKALKILATTGVGSELRTILWEIEKRG
jgi:hypothetical protein